MPSSVASDDRSRPRLSVIVPSRDEERLLPGTLDSIEAARVRLADARGAGSEVIVVDNDSSDATADVAREHDAQVVFSAGRSVAAVRNAGAKVALGATLVFVDADVRIPPHALLRAHEALDDEKCIAGYPDVVYTPHRRSVAAYLGAYRLFGRITGMAQGSAQFCRRSSFDAVGGYDEDIFMGEDVDFMWRLGKLGKDQGLSVVRLPDVRLTPSSRRFDRWPLWRILLFTNPLIIRPLMRRRAAWSGWYEDAPR